MTQQLERDLQEQCALLLEYDGWRRLRTDPVSRREWGKGFGEPGMADDLFIRYSYLAGATGEPGPCRTIEGKSVAEVLWIEWKRARGKTATKAAAHQKQWHLLERKRGALTLIAGEDFPATVDGFIGWYQKSGLMRREFKTRDQQLHALRK